MNESGVRGLLAAIDEGYDADAWHGSNLTQSLKGVKAAEAAWKPALAPRSIHKIVVHAAYWKYAVIRALLGDAAGAFAYPGQDWYDRPDTAEAWRADLVLLAETHRRLREAVAALTPEDLQRELRASLTVEQIVRGIAMHDAYHAGQIESLRQAYKANRAQRTETTT